MAAIGWNKINVLYCVGVNGRVSFRKILARNGDDDDCSTSFVKAPGPFKIQRFKSNS